MAADGFSETSPEYIAAQLYFSQNPGPDKVVVGRWNKATEGGETITDALNICRSKNTDWYGFIVCGADAATREEAARWAENTNPVCVHFYNTSDSGVHSYYKQLGWIRSFGLFHTTEDADAAVLGRAMGLNTHLSGSAFTMALKNLVGIIPSDLSLTDITMIKGFNGNVYLSRGGTYETLEDGVMANGKFYDELLNTDMLVNGIQIGIMDLLVSSPKVPQTSPGVTQIIDAIETACRSAVNTGFLAPGRWNGATFKSVNKGDMLVKGYIILADSIDDQSAADRAARKAPNIYVLCKLAGAIQSVLIQVSVNA